MKKITCIAFILMFLSVSLLCAKTTSDPYTHYMIGHIDAATDFSVNILEEALPFDLESAEVQYNENYSTTIKGLRIGYYSLLSNTKSFWLYIAHTKLALRGTADITDPGTLSEIDYRLYVVADFNSSHFLSCLSDPNAAQAYTATQHVVIEGSDSNVWNDSKGMASIVNQSLYVSIDDSTCGTTADTIEALKAGTYESTVYFMLMGN